MRTCLNKELESFTTTSSLPCSSLTEYLDFYVKSKHICSYIICNHSPFLHIAICYTDTSCTYLDHIDAEISTHSFLNWLFLKHIRNNDEFHFSFIMRHLPYKSVKIYPTWDSILSDHQKNTDLHVCWADWVFIK